MSEVPGPLDEKTLNVNEIYLDPNNPRFMRDEMVEEGRTKEKAIQDKLLETMKEYDLDVLKENIRENGFLRIDRIVVRPLAGGGYVVLEGNRRVAALKLLLQEHRDEGRTIRSDQLKTIESVEVLVYEGTDPEASWFYQGLRSIAGIKDWTPYQKAKFIADRKDRNGLAFAQIAKTLGIQAPRVSLWYRSYKAFQFLREHEEYGEMIKTDKFAYVTDGIFSSGCNGIKNWLGWDEGEEKFKNAPNVAIFLSWLFPSDEGKPVRVSRAQDLRDHVCYWAGSDNDFFEEFVNGDLTVDQARVVRATKLQSQATEQAVTKKTLDEYLASIQELGARIPKLPLVEAFERKNEVAAVLSKIKDEIAKVLKLLEAQQS